MQIQCKECGAQNELGAIFCRECGERLDLDDLEPEIQDDKETSYWPLVKRIVGFVVLVLVVLILIGLFVPDKPYVESLSETEKETASTRYNAMMKKIENDFGSSSKFTYSPSELSYIVANQIIKQASEEDDSKKTTTDLIDNVYFNVNDWGYTTIVIDSKLVFFNTTFMLFGKIEQDEYQDEENPSAISIKFVPYSAKMGSLPMPGFLYSTVIGKFEPLLDNENVQKILKATQEVEIVDDGDLAITLKKEDSL